MWRTLVGLILAAATGAGLYLIARRRYKCPHCGRIVQWADINCPHCGNDMKFRHRAGPETLPRAAESLRPPRRRSRDS